MVDSRAPHQRPCMPGQIVPLLDGVARITAPNGGMMTGPGTNTYVVGHAQRAVIDVGCADPGHIATVLQAGAGRIRHVLVTHGHPDHAPGAYELARRVGARVYGYGTRGHAPGQPFRPQKRLRHREVVAGDGWTIEALHTPGHARDHLCFLLREHRVLFSGDHLMQGSTVVIAPPDGDMAAYLHSLTWLRREAIEWIAPGHGTLIPEAVEEIDRVASHRLAREAAIVQTLAACGPSTATQIVAHVYPGLHEALREWAALSVYAHLRKLRTEGRVSGRSRHHRWTLAAPSAQGSAR